MPEAILRVLLELLALDHAAYRREVRRIDRGLSASILGRLAGELSAVPDDEVIKSWEEWLNPLQSILAEEMDLIDRMPGEPKAPGAFRLLQAIALTFRLMASPSAEVCDWALVATAECPEPVLRRTFVESCVHHLGAPEVNRRLRAFIQEGSEERRRGAVEALAFVAD